MICTLNRVAYLVTMVFVIENMLLENYLILIYGCLNMYCGIYSACYTSFLSRHLKIWYNGPHTKEQMR